MVVSPHPGHHVLVLLAAWPPASLILGLVLGRVLRP
jgi:hypothetical protein